MGGNERIVAIDARSNFTTINMQLTRLHKSYDKTNTKQNINFDAGIFKSRQIAKFKHIDVMFLFKHQ